MMSHLVGVNIALGWKYSLSIFFRFNSLDQLKALKVCSHSQYFIVP